MRHISALLLLILAITVLSSSAENAPASPITEEVFCDFNPDDLAHKIISVSSDCSNAAFVVRDGSKMVTVVNGKKGDAYDMIFRPRFSPDGSLCAYVARDFQNMFVVAGQTKSSSYESVIPSSLLMSPDNKSYSFAAVRVGHYYVVTPDSEFGPYMDVREMAYNADGSRLVWTASDNDGYALFINGRRNHKGETSTLTFSDDGKHFAFLAIGEEMKNGDRKPNSVYINDSKVGTTTRNSIEFAFSPDGKRIAYTACGEDGRWRMVLDGKEEAFDLVREPVFSADSKHFAFVARNGEKEFIVYDRSRSRTHDRVSRPYFSPDGKRIAFVAQMTHMEALIENGRMQNEYHDVIEPVFSPDGKNLAYLSRFDNDLFFVLNGIEIRRFTVPYASSLCYSKSGKHFGYVLHCRDGMCLVVENVEKGKFDEVYPGEKYRSSARFAFESLKKEDISETLIYDNLGSRIKMVGDTSMQLVGRKNGKLVRATVTLD